MKIASQCSRSYNYGERVCLIRGCTPWPIMWLNICIQINFAIANIPKILVRKNVVEEITRYFYFFFFFFFKLNGKIGNFFLYKFYQYIIFNSMFYLKKKKENKEISKVSALLLYSGLPWTFLNKRFLIRRVIA